MLVEVCDGEKYLYSVSPYTSLCPLPHRGACDISRWLVSWWWSIDLFFCFSHSCRLNYMKILFIYDVFILFPVLLIVLYGIDCNYISFYFFYFCHSIEIDYIFFFHFGPYSFNYGIDFKSLNIFGIKVWTFFNFFFDWNWSYILFSFQPSYLYFLF